MTGSDLLSLPRAISDSLCQLALDSRRRCRLGIEFFACCRRCLCVCRCRVLSDAPVVVWAG